MLHNLQTERASWENLLAVVGEERMTRQLGVARNSVKDIVALLDWHEQQTIDVLRPAERLLPARDWLWAEPEAERDTILYIEFRDQPLRAVLEREQDTYGRLLAAISATAEEESHDAETYPGMSPAWQPWSLIAAHSYGRYLNHAPMIRAWLEQEDADAGKRANAAVAIKAPQGH